MAAKNNTELIQDLTNDMRQLGERLAVHTNVTDRELKQHSERLSRLADGIDRLANADQEILNRVIALATMQII